MAVADAGRGIYRGYYGQLAKWRDRCAGGKLGREIPPIPDDQGALQELTFFRDISGREHRAFAKFIRRLVAGAQSIKTSINALCSVERPKKEDQLKFVQETDSRLSEEKQRAEAIYAGYRKKLERSIEYPIRPSIHFLAFLVIGVLEIAVNWLAVQSIVLEAPWLDFLIAVAIGGILLFLTYVVGFCAKRSLIAFHFVEATERSEKGRYISAIGYLTAFLVLGMFLVFIVYRVGLIRQDFIDTQRSGTSSSQNSLLSGALATIVQGPRNAVLHDDGWLLIYLSSALLFMGAAVSFVNHDTDGRFAHAKRILDEADKRFGSYQATLQQCRDNLRVCDSEIAALEHRRESIWRDVIATREERAQMILLRLGYFADGNRIARKSDVPGWLRAPDHVVVADAIASKENLVLAFQNLDVIPET